MKIDFWEIYASPLGRNIHFSLGMPPFTGSNYIREKGMLLTTC